MNCCYLLAADLTLKQVMSHCMEPIERACRKDHACHTCISILINTSKDMSQVKVLVTDGHTDGRMSFNVPHFCIRWGTINIEIIMQVYEST